MRTRFPASPLSTAALLATLFGCDASPGDPPADMGNDMDAQATACSYGVAPVPPAAARIGQPIAAGTILVSFDGEVARSERSELMGRLQLRTVEAARLALLSHLQPDLAGFGPVGFYLAQRVGGAGLFALGVAWPVAVGLGAFAVAYRGFRSADRV